MKSLGIIALVGLLPAGILSAASDIQTFTLDHKLQIPGATLKSGQYTFEVEDRLQDRAIIRITDVKKNSHELLLAVPNEKLNQGDRSQLILFPAHDSDKQILHGWMCPSCQTALEVVYPKAEAVKITGVSAKPVLAVDPTYDKLPKNLSADDMKVVTLWLLSPKEVTPDEKGKGLEAAKWADVNAPKRTEMADAKPAPTAPTETAEVSRPAATPAAPTAPAETPASVAPAAPVAPEAPTSASVRPAEPSSPAVPAQEATSAVPATNNAPTAPVETASVSHGTRHMPHTASNTYTWGLLGLLCFGAASGSWVQRRLAHSRVK